MPRQRLNSAAQRNDAKGHFRTSAPALRASATPNIVRRSAETARYIRSIGAYYRPHKQFRLHREPLSSDSQRLFSLRNARTTPMERERPDQGLPESMLSMIWKGPFRFLRVLTEASRPIFRIRTPPMCGTSTVGGEYGRSRAERERIRLIREACTNYESVFPQSDPLTEQREESPISAANVRRGDEALP